MKNKFTVLKGIALAGLFSSIGFTAAADSVAENDPELQHECTSWMVLSDLKKIVSKKNLGNPYISWVCEVYFPQH